MIDKTEVTKVLRSFILENYLFTQDEGALKNSDSFLESKILDSMGILELINYLKDEFDITVHESEMIPSNLDSIDNLVAFMGKKTQ